MNSDTTESWVECTVTALLYSSTSQPPTLLSVLLNSHKGPRKSQFSWHSQLHMSFKNTSGFKWHCSLTGVLLRKLEAGLRGISHVIVDEIHERDLNVSAVCFCGTNVRVCILPSAWSHWPFEFLWVMGFLEYRGNSIRGCHGILHLIFTSTIRKYQFW